VSAERVGRQQWGRERASVRLSPPVEVCTPPIRQTGETSARARGPPHTDDYSERGTRSSVRPGQSSARRSSSSSSSKGGML